MSTPLTATGTAQCPPSAQHRDLDGYRPIRRDQLQDPCEGDPDAARYTPRAPAFCPECGAVFDQGRWRWSDQLPPGAAAHTCIACWRIRERIPAGFLHVGGPYSTAHRDELTELMQHREDGELAEHPMERIITIRNADDGVLVTTTGIHLARDLGEMLERAREGRLDYHYNEVRRMLRVFWRR